MDKVAPVINTVRLAISLASEERSEGTRFRVKAGGIGGKDWGAGHASLSTSLVRRQPLSFLSRDWKLPAIINNVTDSATTALRWTAGVRLMQKWWDMNGCPLRMPITPLHS